MRNGESLGARRRATNVQLVSKSGAGLPTSNGATSNNADANNAAPAIETMDATDVTVMPNRFECAEAVDMAEKSDEVPAADAVQPESEPVAEDAHEAGQTPVLVSDLPMLDTTPSLLALQPVASPAAPNWGDTASPALLAQQNATDAQEPLPAEVQAAQVAVEPDVSDLPSIRQPVPLPYPIPSQIESHFASGPLQNNVMSYSNLAAPLQQQSAWQMPPSLHRPFPPSPQNAPSPQYPNAQLTHVPWQAADSWGATTLNISSNTAAGASYLFWWVSGLLVYFNERNNRFVRFHALQSIILTGTLTVTGVCAVFFATIMHDLTISTRQDIFFHLGLGLAILIALVIVFSWLVTMIAAWTGNYLRVPFIGTYAERYAAPPGQPARNPLF